MAGDVGMLYPGVAEAAGSADGGIAATNEDNTDGAAGAEPRPAYTTGYVSGGVGYGYRGWGWRGGGGFVSMDNPGGSESKALLTAPDGSGLRCDFRSGYGNGGGICFDDKGRAYGGQVRRTAGK